MNWIFGDNINTDVITPGRYNMTTDAKQLAGIAFIEIRPEFAGQVKSGDLIIAGQNFGCGSSRETAPIALKTTGIRAIIAKSFARIFYRNSLNIGLLLITAATDGIRENDQLNLDLKNNLLINNTQKTKVKITIPKMMIRLYREGGIINYLKTNGLTALSDFS
ncbi:MAG: 3-isopropylmalate dehydratase small subunit [Candidatus Gottesmanbacteria bacterium GW2011_GWA2_43_14]|uniref:3-isopropylmalate dehydratase small subunit n=1 Tax=Candidatus Gottesmanbacteria bacterium GW2011_GWA2_43_14 TaxID=1618443 RepID=A0A0G1GJ04_9BACT|nr:MAG: 3-isopropylmalate dehydratase small subunit [Candidatus Gottesmanbacteria bacterium GW2011_GWA2_43_14]